MAIEATIYDRLNHTSITATVSDRIFPTDPEEGTPYPFLVYTIQSTSPVTSLSGASGITQHTVSIDVWARSLTQRTALEAAVRSRLHAYRGGSISGAFLVDQSAEQIGDATEGDIYHGTQQYTVWAADTGGGSQGGGGIITQGYSLDFSNPDNSGYLALM